MLSYAADIFALGVMAFRYLGGHDPFYPASKVTDELEVDESTWHCVSDAARHFVIQVLSPQPSARGNAALLLKDGAWLITGDAKQSMTALQPPSPVQFLDLEEARASWVRSYADL